MMQLRAGQPFATNLKKSWLQPGPVKVMRLVERSFSDLTQWRWKRHRFQEWLRRL
ncbi:hypothetical protein QL093DRAFT_2370495 [Fusarium oxysporum]|nr:hypothetical protein QL093DRAFT_2370495 [Fusarium oxysporum]